MYRVMVVDDDVPFLNSLKQYDWESLNCRCVCASVNGRDALFQCARVMPHIVITDINMPFVDGIELIRAIHERFPQIQTILLTVHQDFSYAQQAVSLGACEYLVKDTQYHKQLPLAIKRAIANFENHSADHVSFLRRGGKLLFLGGGTKAGMDELDAFLSNNRGQLLTVRMLPPLPSRAALLRGIDSCLQEPVGWIIRENDTVELLGRDEQLLLETVSRLPLPQCRRCIGSCQVLSVQDYRSVHAENLVTLESAFYKATDKLLRGGNTHFEQLSRSRSETWAQQMINALAEDKLAQCLYEIGQECSQVGYVPQQVRDSIVRAVHLSELRWAERMDSDIHEHLSCAESLNKLLSIAEEYMLSLYRCKSTMSLPCARAMDVMRRNLSDPELSLNQVAEQVYISPGYLSKKLKDETGMSFKDLLIRLRMERAAELVRQGRDRVYEIAIQIGYQNYRSFSTAFSGYYGKSVKEYRRENQ